MKKTIVIIMLFFGTSSAFGAELFVPSQYPTIQAAIDASQNGDTVTVADGVYTGEGNRRIEVIDKSITARSANGPENCIIDCNGTSDNPSRGFTFYQGEDANSILDGFTIINASGLNGGAIRCARYSNLIISNCVIRHCLAGSGAGIYCDNVSRVIIKNCVVSQNSTISKKVKKKPKKLGI